MTGHHDDAGRLGNQPAPAEDRLPLDFVPSFLGLGGQQADPDSFEHPDWCDRTRCTAHRYCGDHWSAPLRVDPPDRAGFPTFELALWTDAYQDIAFAPAWADLRIIRPSLSRTVAVDAFELQPDQMRRLAAALTATADRVEAIAARAAAAVVEYEAMGATWPPEDLDGGGDDGAG